MYSVLLSRLRLQSMMKSQFSDPFLHNIRFFTNDNTTTSESYCYIYVNNFSPTINLYQDRYIDLCSPPSMRCSIRLFLDPQNKYYLDDFVYRPGMSLSCVLTTRVSILYDSESVPYQWWNPHFDLSVLYCELQDSTALYLDHTRYRGGMLFFRDPSW